MRRRNVIVIAIIVLIVLLFCPYTHIDDSDCYIMQKKVIDWLVLHKRQSAYCSYISIISGDGNDEKYSDPDVALLRVLSSETMLYALGSEVRYNPYSGRRVVNENGKDAMCISLTRVKRITLCFAFCRGEQFHNCLNAARYVFVIFRVPGGLILIVPIPISVS